uniref:Pentatricopeptide repeat-containing protein n=1 Tax=Kalanchoe fedtschenkoi TaxID=63787 RepID=A0A7N0TV83_KALFE
MKALWRFHSGATVHAGKCRVAFSRLIQSLRASQHVTVADSADMFFESRQLEHVVQVFDELPSRDVVSATASISGFIDNNHFEKALLLFSRMIALGIRPNEGLISNVYAGSAALNFYAKLADVKGATRVLEDTHKPNVVSYTTLICAYLKNEQFDDALTLFQTMPERNGITWNAMIGGYSQAGKNEEAVNLFVEMLRENVLPTQFTYPCVVSAASNIAALGMGKSFHASSIKVLGNPNLFVGNSLISLYAKCASMEDSRIIFDKLPVKNIVSWNAIICGYAQNGKAREAMELYHRMKCDGIKSNGVTLLGLLLACNHSGLVDEGCSYFNEAKIENPRMLKPEHYGCMVDILCRSGRLEEAEQFLSSMPFSAGIGFWKALLGGSQTHSNMEVLALMEGRGQKRPELGELPMDKRACSRDAPGSEYPIHIQAAANSVSSTLSEFHDGDMDTDHTGTSYSEGEHEDNSAYGSCDSEGSAGEGSVPARYAAKKILGLDPGDVSSYVMLSNACSAAGNWHDVSMIRREMKVKKMKRIPGCSWIEIKSKVHNFVRGDKRHEEKDDIYYVLNLYEWDVKDIQAVIMLIGDI